jgi:signal transduction histidine kinase
LTLSKLKKISIKWRLFFYLLTLTAVTLILLWLFQIVFLDAFYKGSKINEIEKATVKISTYIDSDSLKAFVKQTAIKSEANVIVADMSGKTLYSADYIPGNRFMNGTEDKSINLIKKAKKNGGSYLTWLAISDDTGMLQYPPGYFEPQRSSAGGKPKKPATGGPNKQTPDLKNQPVQARSPFPSKSGDSQTVVYTLLTQKNNGKRLAIVFEANITPVDATVNTIRTQFLYIAGFLLISTLLLAFFISARVSKPIIRINRSAKALAKGNYDVTFDESAYREVSELGATLNYATKELAKTENLRRELLANISHDLRTPLTMITGYAEVMRDLPGENNQENIQIIIDEAKRLSALVNDVLALSKMQTGVEELHMSEFNITQSIQGILKRYTKLTEQEGYLIEFSHDTGAIVFADELRISQVLYNLINNALTYIGADKKIVVKQIVNERNVRVEVIDSGNGISQENLPFIFDRYYRASKGHKRSENGTGLGLSIVKAILEQHNARYGVMSTVGKGSTFWFELTVANFTGNIVAGNRACQEKTTG